MKRNGSISIAVFIAMCLLLSGGTAFAGGFGLYEGSVRANGLGGSVIAKADDPASAIFFNPAGMTQLTGTQMSAGGTVITPMTTVETEQWGHRENNSLKWNYFFPPYAYVTHQLNDRFWVGLGFFARFGLGTEFDENWPGRHNSYNAFVRGVELNPNVAYKVTDKLSLSAGMSVERMDLKLESRAPIFDVDTVLKGDGYGVGYNLGAHYKLLDWIKLGLSYRSKIHIDLGGRSYFIRPNYLGGLFHNGHIDSTTTLPDELMMGVNFQMLHNLSFEVSAIRTGWSNFDKMSIVFSHPVAGMGRVTKEKNWNDVWRYQFGFEYNATDWLDLRCGYVYDNGPIPRDRTDYLVPSNDRQMYCIGVGFHWRSWTVDLSYDYLISRNRSVAARPADGVLKGRMYDGQTDLYGLGVSYKF